MLVTPSTGFCLKYSYRSSTQTQLPQSVGFNSYCKIQWIGHIGSDLQYDPVTEKYLAPPVDKLTNY